VRTGGLHIDSLTLSKACNVIGFWTSLAPFFRHAVRSAIIFARFVYNCLRNPTNPTNCLNWWFVRGNCIFWTTILRDQSSWMHPFSTMTLVWKNFTFDGLISTRIEQFIQTHSTTYQISMASSILFNGIIKSSINASTSCHSLWPHRKLINLQNIARAVERLANR